MVMFTMGEFDLEVRQTGLPCVHVFFAIPEVVLVSSGGSGINRWYRGCRPSVLRSFDVCFWSKALNHLPPTAVLFVAEKTVMFLCCSSLFSRWLFHETLMT